MTGPPIAKPRGRPRVDPKGTRVSSWVRPNEYDKLVRMANQKEVSLSSLVRSLLVLKLR
jgi:hypothetical protein